MMGKRIEDCVTYSQCTSRGIRVGKYCVLVLVVMFCSNAGAQICVQPSADIIAWWPFDETSGTFAEDIVGNNPGVYVNGPTHADGIFGGAVRFDGSDDYIGVPDSDLWAFGSNDFTIELWANWDRSGGGSIGHPGDIFIGNDEGAGTRNKWFFALGGGVLNFHINGPGTGSRFFPRAPFSPVVGRWYHLAVTREGNTFTIYVDGQSAASATESRAIPNANAPLTIGQAERLGYMNGRLDEITIYNRALSQEELQAIYEAGSAGKCKELAIATESLWAILFGEYSAQDLETVFGEPPFTWSIVDGNLPSGMSLDPNGILSGTPAEAGEFSITIRVTDGNNDIAEKIFALEVHLTLPPPIFNTHKVGTVPVPGRTVDYFILVENIGKITANDVEVLEVLAPSDYFTYISADPEPNIVSEMAIFWIVPSIDPGKSQVLRYSVKLNPAIPFGSNIPGAAWAGSSGEGIEASRSWADHQQNLSCILNSPECQQGLFLCAQYGCHPFSNISYCSACPSLWRECTRNCDECELHIETWSVICEPATGAIDPNKKVSLAKRFIQPDQLLVYAIHFENIGEIEARDVFLTDVLDSNLDISTLELLSVEGGSFDPATRTVRWELLDRNLLPGETDNVLFSIRPLPDLPSGTEIRNTGEIQFEVFEPIATNEVVNIIDTDPPYSSMDILPSESSTTEFMISWSGEDIVGEIDFYTIFVSVDGGGFVPFLEKTGDTSAIFPGEADRTYDFVSIATDTAGNVEIKEALSEAQTHVIANIAPVADAGEDQTVYVGIDCMVEIALDGSGSSDPDGDELMYSWQMEGVEIATGVDPNIILPLGEHIITLIVNDGLEDSMSDEVVITVVDTTTPTIVCPEDVILECPADTCPEETGTATATDNCDDLSAITFSDISMAGCGNTETIIRTWTATDASGNSSACDQVIEVVDTTPPTFTTIPQDLTVECDGSGNQEELNAWLNSADANDVCGSSVTIINDYVALSDDCGETGSATVTWTATDECGNTVTTSATFTIEDSLPPVIELNGEAIVTVECHIGSYTELGATALDDCDAGPIEVIIGGDVVDIDTFGTYYVTYDAVDDCGNAAEQVTREVNVVDTTAPVVIVGDMVEIWPANHKYHEFNLSDLVVSVDDACGGWLDVDAVGTIISIYSDEPEDVKGNGDGKTTDDIVMLGTSSFKVRSERQGKGDGRVYGVTFEVVDEAGNITTETCYVGVPHDRSGNAPIDDGGEAGYTVD